MRLTLRRLLVANKQALQHLELVFRASHALRLGRLAMREKSGRILFAKVHLVRDILPGCETRTRCDPMIIWTDRRVIHTAIGRPSTGSHSALRFGGRGARARLLQILKLHKACQISKRIYLNKVRDGGTAIILV